MLTHLTLKKIYRKVFVDNWSLKHLLYFEHSGCAVVRFNNCRNICQNLSDSFTPSFTFYFFPHFAVLPKDFYAYLTNCVGVFRETGYVTHKKGTGRPIVRTYRRNRHTK
jgi:hypothetical protein